MNEEIMMQMQQMQEMQGMQGPSVGFLIVTIIIALLVYVFMSYCMARIAVKMGMPFKKSFIWALIPIANTFLFLKLAGKPMWWFILFFIPIANFVIIILSMLGFVKRLGKSGWWVLWLILFGPIVIIILAFEGKKTEAGPTTV